MRNAERALERAVERFEADEAKLYRADGEPLYSGPEMAERRDALLDGVRAVAEEVRQVAATMLEQAELDALAVSADPTEQLTGEELQTANARAAFVREDLEGMAPPQLGKRLQAVLATGDKVALWLHHRYAGQLFDRLRERMTTAPATLDGEDRQRMGILRKMVPQLADALVDPAAKKRAEAASAKKESAQRLRMLAGRTVAQLDGTIDQAAGLVGRMF